MSNNKDTYVKKEVCFMVVEEVFLPTRNCVVINSRHKEGKPISDFVRFTVYEEEKQKDRRKKDDRKLFINDHRETTLCSARSQISMKRGMCITGKVLSLAEAVRLPARVVVVEVPTETGSHQFVNLFPRERGKASGLFVVLSEIFIRERVFLGSIERCKPLWWWGGTKNTSFGPSGDTLPVVALTNKDRRIIFHCRKSHDIVTIGSEVKTESPLSL